MPGGVVCSVSSCKNNCKKTKMLGQNVMYFSFPRDSYVCNEWMKKCGRNRPFSPLHSRICSIHFKPDDFEDELQARLMGTRAKKLKKTAIPSLHIPSELASDETFPESRAEETVIKFNQIEPAHNIALLHNYANTSNCVPMPPNMKEIEFITLNIVNDSNQSVLQSTNNQQELELERQIEILKSENHILKSKLSALQKKDVTLNTRCINAENQVKQTNAMFEEKVKLAFKDFLTEKQIEMVLYKRSKVRWSQTDFSRAFSLKRLSKPCYIYLKDVLHYPLPGLSTLDNWYCNIKAKEQARRGLNDDNSDDEEDDAVNRIEPHSRRFTLEKQ